MENNKERIVKVVTWRILSIFITLIVMGVATGNVIEASTITAVLHIIMVICHYFFEMQWEKRFGFKNEGW